MAFLMKSLNNISRCQAAYRNLRVESDGLCPCHHAFVLAVGRDPGRSQEELARELCLNKSTVARALNHLEENGFVTRRPHKDDKRRLSVYPTERLISVLPEIREVAKDWNDSITEGISQSELDIFRSVLERMEQKARETVERQEAAK